ncbi:MAG TPA: tripartite tricarboxylate transporter substrate binding protein [Burkholderiales bacterium]|nr:tripartite tricarboxylate transporter substrate binding protein [Burkholderiales bacterium]
MNALTKALGLLALLAATAAAAQTYPSRPVHVIVPQPPGGGFDTGARTLAEPLAALLGQPVVVENRPGGGTLVGTEAAAKAAPDGYTLLLGASANLVYTPALYRSVPFDPRADFVPVGLAVANTYTLVARNDLPLRSLQEVVRYARENPGKLTFASAGNGTGQHIAAAVLWHLAGVNVTHVPYKGAQAAYQDLLPGRVDLFFDATQTARGQVSAGRVRALAVSGPQRAAIHPDVPTVRETGVADFDMVSWLGYFAPAATPAPVLERLRADFARVLAEPKLRAGFEKQGLRMLDLAPDETRSLVARDIEKWRALIRGAGLHAD